MFSQSVNVLLAKCNWNMSHIIIHASSWLYSRRFVDRVYSCICDFVEPAQIWSSICMGSSERLLRINVVVSLSAPMERLFPKDHWFPFSLPLAGEAKYSDDHVCLCLCVFVCPWAYVWNYPSDLHQFFLWMLPMAMARSSSAIVAISYVLRFMDDVTFAHNGCVLQRCRPASLMVQPA